MVDSIHGDKVHSVLGSEWVSGTGKSKSKRDHSRIALDRLSVSVRCADGSPSLRWRWKQLHYTAMKKDVYVNIKSFAKNMGITREAARTILREAESFEAAVVRANLQSKGLEGVLDLEGVHTLSADEMLSIRRFEKMARSDCAPGKDIILTTDQLFRTLVKPLGEGAENSVYELQGVAEGAPKLALRVPKMKGGDAADHDAMRTLLWRLLSFTGEEMPADLTEDGVEELLQKQFGITTETIAELKRDSEHTQYCHFPFSFSTEDPAVSIECVGIPFKFGLEGSELAGIASGDDEARELALVRKTLDESRKLDPPLNRREIIKQMLDCVGFLLKKNLAHNDLHAGNFLLFKESGEWKLKIIDFDTLRRTGSAADLIPVGQFILRCMLLPETGTELSGLDKGKIIKLATIMSRYDSSPSVAKAAHRELVKMFS